MLRPKVRRRRSKSGTCTCTCSSLLRAVAGVCIARGASCTELSHALRGRGLNRGSPDAHTPLHFSPVASHFDFSAWVPGVAFSHDAVRRPHGASDLSRCAPQMAAVNLVVYFSRILVVVACLAAPRVHRAHYRLRRRGAYDGRRSGARPRRPATVRRLRCKRCAGRVVAAGVLCS